MIMNMAVILNIGNFTGTPSFAAKTMAAMIGAMQHIPIGFLRSRKVLKTRTTSSSTSGSELTPKVDRFLAAPKPPGKITAEKFSACNS